MRLPGTGQGSGPAMSAKLTRRAAPMICHVEHRHLALAEHDQHRRPRRGRPQDCRGVGTIDCDQQPRSAASPIMASADSRRAVVHILVRKLKLSSIRRSASGCVRSSIASNASTPRLERRIENSDFVPFAPERAPPRSGSRAANKASSSPAASDPERGSSNAPAGSRVTLPSRGFRLRDRFVDSRGGLGASTSLKRPFAAPRHSDIDHCRRSPTHRRRRAAYAHWSAEALLPSPRSSFASRSEPPPPEGVSLDIKVEGSRLRLGGRGARKAGPMQRRKRAPRQSVGSY